MEHHCGVLGLTDIMINKKLIEGLNMLQHRGYESAGISYLNGVSKKIELHTGLGTVKKVFQNHEFNCISQIGIGHVRYSTVKKTNLAIKKSENQPFIGITKFGKFALAHNGNIPDINKLKSRYKIDSNTNSDTLLLTRIIEKLSDQYDSFENCLIHIINAIPGAYCLCILTKNSIYGIRDRFGIRPLYLGKSNTSGYCIASESVAFIDYDLIREIKPGEIIKIDKNKNPKTVFQRTSQPAFCSFELFYFMNHQSKLDGYGYGYGYGYENSVEKIRFDLGYELGKQESVIDNNSIVVCIPNSSIPSAYGFSNAIKVPYFDYIVKNKNMKRTFILPTEKERKLACDKKFSYDIDGLKDKNIYLIDDSIVRGTTMKSVIDKLKNIGVKRINVRIVSPAIVSPCYFGIDMSTKNELIANNRTNDQIKEKLGVNSLKYLDINSMKKIFKIDVCTSCFTGKYEKELLDW